MTLTITCQGHFYVDLIYRGLASTGLNLSPTGTFPCGDFTPKSDICRAGRIKILV
jgi:hypothetical protein